MDGRWLRGWGVGVGKGVVGAGGEPGGGRR